jgi:hypothetical protein
MITRAAINRHLESNSLSIIMNVDVPINHYRRLVYENAGSDPMCRIAAYSLSRTGTDNIEISTHNVRCWK